MGKNNMPPKWVNVYPQGTQTGDEEQRLFIALGRHPKYEWRSVATLAKESNLTKERVEQILNKYLKKGMVFQSSKNETLWAYWERVPQLVKKDVDICKKDHECRISQVIS